MWHCVIYGVGSWNGVVEWSGVEFGVEWSWNWSGVSIKTKQYTILYGTCVMKGDVIAITSVFLT